MLPSAVESWSGLVAELSTDFILLQHHPDLSRRPAGAAGSTAERNRCAALTWNVFRTLELISPAFWLRRFGARLGSLSSYDTVAGTLSIRLWPHLPGFFDSRHGDPIQLDVLVETDAAVYGVMAFDGTDVELGDTTLARPDALLRMIDGVSWHAGVRDCHIAMLTTDRRDTPVGSALVARYRASHDGLRRRLSHRRDGLHNVRSIGMATWRDMNSIMHDCVDAPSLSTLERCAARRTSEWLSSIGVYPVD